MEDINETPFFKGFCLLVGETEEESTDSVAVDIGKGRFPLSRDPNAGLHSRTFGS